MSRPMTPEEAIRVVRIVYTNHRGVTSIRNVLPCGFRFGTCDFHRGAQWLMDAYDVDKESDRTFAVRDIVKWL